MKIFTKKVAQLKINFKIFSKQASKHQILKLEV